MKKFLFLLILCYPFFINYSNCQKFIKYQTWASEKFINPDDGNLRLPFLYDWVKFNMVGDFNGSIDENNIPIKSIALVTVRLQNFLDQNHIFQLDSFPN